MQIALIGHTTRRETVVSIDEGAMSRILTTLITVKSVLDDELHNGTDDPHGMIRETYNELLTLVDELRWARDTTTMPNARLVHSGTGEVKVNRA